MSIIQPYGAHLTVGNCSTANGCHQGANGTSGGIADFYRGANVFITGATGFVGKALVEKLLRTCDVNAIHLLIRPKRDKSAADRLTTILANPIFDPIRKQWPGRLAKVKVIEGNLEKPNCGVSETDAIRLIDAIDVVFHSAASIKFNDKLTSSLRTNTLGSYHMIEFGARMKRIKAFVYVSTAYCNVDKREIGEIIYRPNHKPLEMLNLLRTAPESIDRNESSYIKGHPNTYTYSKSLAENLLLDYVHKVPITIVRPSVVAASWKEPFPGWFDGYNLINFFLIETYRGTLNYFLCKSDIVLDLIPVDVLTNCLMNAAWLDDKLKTDSIRVYHCTSGKMNSIQLEPLIRIVESVGRRYPSIKSLFYPSITITSQQQVHKFLWFVSRTIPAGMYDVASLLKSQKPTMLAASRRIEKSWTVMAPFLYRDWTFHDDNFRMLERYVAKACDGDRYAMSIRKDTDFEWSDYMRAYILNLRRRFLNEDMDNVDEAKTRLKSSL